MGAILRRELNAYFRGAIGYVYLALFFAFTGVIYFIIVYSGLSSMMYTFAYAFYIGMYLIPLLTMRLLSEDRKLRTDQLLLTSPVRLSELVVGKFLAAFLVFALGISMMIPEAVVLSAFSAFDWPVFFTSLVGILLLGAASIAICMLFSALTENQIIAAVLGFVSMLLLSILDQFASVVSSETIKNALLGLSFYTRFFNLTLGVIDFSDVFFFFSVTGVFLFLTARVLEKQRWS
ncbi:MAG TPA: ABC transporter permease subunit [Oscillospiraceae bacterium]|jgi:ABC-2 type transport system permease protein|nr:ABC transporter permease subunit [Oscillospiraceae bacterium]HRW57331.1 ABC transporter permease subunit [Oscillospiraceae bacterium]